ARRARGGVRAAGGRPVLPAPDQPLRGEDLPGPGREDAGAREDRLPGREDRLGARRQVRKTREERRAMSDVRITVGPYEFLARWEDERCPKTCEAFERLLPYRQ